MNRTLSRVAVLAGLSLTAALAAAAPPDWSQVPSREITVLYPGYAGLEWVMKGTDHSGAKAVKGGETCAGCHDKEAADVGRKIVTGQLAALEPNPPKGKAGSIPVTVQAAHDGANLYLRFRWKAPAAAGGARRDPANQVKLTVMMDAGKVEYAAQGACWATCHNDLRSMDDAVDAARAHPRAAALGWSDGVTKYLKESRTEVNLRNKPRGGWDKLRPDAEIAAALKDGVFLDLMQFRSGGAPVDGYVLESRHMSGGKDLVSAEGRQDGDTWTVTFVRRLTGGGPVDHPIVAGKVYHIGFAIHDDWANARFLHVSLGHSLALDGAKADIVAVRR